MSAMRRIGPVLSLAAGLLAAAPATAAPVWGGTIGEEEGVPLVMNPAADPGPERVVDAVEQWRLGGENEDDPLLGLVTDADVAEDGTTYLLDGNLNQIHVLDAGGELLRTIGREGDGPGEFRNARRVALLPNGDVAVMVALPGQIVVLGPDGTPRPSLQLEGLGAAMGHFESMAADARGIVVGGMSTTFDDGSITMRWSLARFGIDGTRLATLKSDEDTQSGGSFNFSGGGDEFTRYWAPGDDGRIIVFGQEHQYRLSVYGPEGELERIIVRDYASLKRTDEDMAAARRQREEMQQRFSSSAMFEIDEYERDIPAVVARPDGALWVATSRGVRACPAGSVGWFDVLDREGRQTGRLRVGGVDYDPDRDNYAVRGDRLFVFKEAQMTSTTMSSGGGAGGQMMVVMSGGGAADEDEDEEARPFEVICYHLP